MSEIWPRNNADYNSEFRNAIILEKVVEILRNGSNIIAMLQNKFHMDLDRTKPSKCVLTQTLTGNEQLRRRCW